ncbi:hypothetical protein FACS189472_08350 [Alphaproteobacteria bacterium]|nr:hypothetical protein FACS189472_08350 [Alphaproteobacteria bacterium]
MRWGIECMFSDFKSRGFLITDTHLKHEKRIENLILVLTIVTYWGVSVGTAPKKQEKFSEKKQPRSKKSYFKLGLRCTANHLLYLPFSHVLWMFI